MQSRTTGVRDDALVTFQGVMIPLLDSAYSFARYLTRDTDAAQDIVQEAFLRAHRGFHGYRGGSARAWLFTIVRNCYLAWVMERRKASRLSAEPRWEGDGDEFAEFDVASDDDTPEEVLLRKTESEAVRSIIAAMPRGLREIIILREVEELSYQEIAETLSLPIGTVMSRLSRARKRFGDVWQGQANPNGVTPARSAAAE